MTTRAYDVRLADDALAGSHSLQRVVRHPAYALTIIFVVMPMNGAIMESGQVWLGLVLMAMQLPWAIQRVCELYDKDA